MNDSNRHVRIYDLLEFQTWWQGRVLKPDDNVPNTVAIRKINDKIKEDPRVSAVLMDTGDGIYMCLKN